MAVPFYTIAKGTEFERRSITKVDETRWMKTQ